MATENSNLYEIPVTSIDGKVTTMKEYAGKTLLIVNTASKCGYTPQYEGLESLYEKYKDKGLVVLGMPCNQFGGQEPGTEEEIKKFCSLKYNVKFPLLKKSDVNGPNRHPLYQFLLSNSSDKKDIQWNFEKFLVDKNGKVVARFNSKAKPDSQELVDSVEKSLK